MKLNDTHLVLLSAASQCDDGLVSLPEISPEPSTRKAIVALVKAGLLTEVPVGIHLSHWRKDEEGRPVGLRITAAGLGAVGLDTGVENGAGAINGTFEGSEHTGGVEIGEPAVPASAKPGTKRALVLELLGRPGGATLADLTGATGWLPHTTRAALTGLRKNGHAISRSTDEVGRSVYSTKTPATTNA